MKPSNNVQLSVTARASFKVYYEGPAEAVTATNKVGMFDVLPGHADFFSILTPGEIIIETADTPISFNVVNGIITVRDDNVMIFINI
jgi:F0F1-type ATP synthase epsilon subunit